MTTAEVCGFDTVRNEFMAGGVAIRRMRYHLRALSRSWLIVLIVAVCACARDRRPPPRDAAQGCRAAIEAVAEKGQASLALREALACERMYRDPACATAWTRLGAAMGDVSGELAAIEATCRRACIRDSGGAPLRGCIAPLARFGEDSAVGRVIELDRALLRHAGLSPAEAEALSMRTLILAASTQRAAGTVDDDDIDDDPDDDPDDDDLTFRPPPPPPPLSGSAGDTLVVDVDLASIRVYGADVTLDDLEDRVESLRMRHGFTKAEVLSHPDVPYERLIRVLDAVRAGGIDDVMFSARP